VTDPENLEAVHIGKVGAAGVGLGGMATKVEAATLATTAGIPVLLASADQAEQALFGEGVGTWFHASGGRIASRLLWLAHTARPSGRLFLDQGAVAAVVGRRMSLLPAGITGVGGTFAAGDVVDLVAPGGQPVARGLVNYDSAELPALLGRSTHELSRELGDGYSREVVHRDELAVLRPGTVGRQRQRGRR
jgi:glutamate 5-kinase